MGFDFGCVEFYENSRGKKSNEINKAFELMLTELPRRAFSLDPAVRDDCGFYVSSSVTERVYARRLHPNVPKRYNRQRGQP